MTKAQEVYERVEALVASGAAKKADAFRQVAKEYGVEFNSIRGAYYAHIRSTGRSPKRANARTSVDPIVSATIVLEKAIEAIDAEISSAKQRAEQAKTEYEHLRDTASERKAAIQAKIDALKA